VLRDLPDQEVVKKLFDTIAPRFAQRPGGYTRLLRLGYRKGDSAAVAQVELVGSEFNPKAAEKETKAAGEPAKKQGVGGRLRAAAQRIRGRRTAGEEAEAKKEPAEKKPARRSRAAKAKKTDE
jgi:large subunit ribosomal protein L17